ncbi:MAG TPA: DUF1579 family protein [Phycisphaerae bacterium]|nr:DUF1579 family protein [Phycisphaerae bacterium]
MTRSWRILTVGLCAAAAAVGCAKPQNMDPSAMKMPSRPAELDRLESWVGTWQSTGEMKGADGKTMHITGNSTIGWECDRTVLVEKMEGTCEEMKEMKMMGMGVYTWDAHEKEYETAYYDNMGTAADGDMTYNESTKTWKMTGEGYNPMHGQNTHWVGEVKFPDSSTMEWTWATYDAWKMKKLEEGKGTAKRM